MKRTKVLKRLSIDKLMDLKVDFAFKQLFGVEKNKRITITFLNAILQRTGSNRIADILFNNTDAGGEYEEDKQSRLDLLVVTNAGEWVNIEIQFNNKYDMVKRSIYYWAGVYRDSLGKNMSYKELSPVIAINILNFDMFGQTKRFHTSYHLYEDVENFRLTDVVEFHFIEITQLIRDWQADKLDPWNDVLARWLLLLGMVDRRNGKVYEDIFKELEEIAMKGERLNEAFQTWEALSGTREQRIAYEGRMKQILDEASVARDKELWEQDKELWEQDRELWEQDKELWERDKVLLEQKQAELENVKNERQAERKEWQKAQEELQERTVETARKLLMKGMDVGIVVEITELDEKQVLEIQKELL